MSTVKRQGQDAPLSLAALTALGRLPASRRGEELRPPVGTPASVVLCRRRGNVDESGRQAEAGRAWGRPPA